MSNHSNRSHFAPTVASNDDANDVQTTPLAPAEAETFGPALVDDVDRNDVAEQAAIEEINDYFEDLLLDAYESVDVTDGARSATIDDTSLAYAELIFTRHPQTSARFEAEQSFYITKDAYNRTPTPRSEQSRRSVTSMRVWLKTNGYALYAPESKRKSATGADVIVAAVKGWAVLAIDPDEIRATPTKYGRELVKAGQQRCGVKASALRDMLALSDITLGRDAIGPSIQRLPDGIKTVAHADGTATWSCVNGCCAFSPHPRRGTIAILWRSNTRKNTALVAPEATASKASAIASRTMARIARRAGQVENSQI